MNTNRQTDIQLLVAYCIGQARECLENEKPICKKLKKAIATLVIISHGDATVKSEMTLMGVFELIAKLFVAIEAASLDFDDEEKKRKKLRLKDRIQSQLASCCWSLCVAHMPNKEKSKVALDSLIFLLRQSEHGPTLYYAASAIWSACYGTPQNQEHVLNQGGVSHLVKHLIGSPSKELRHALTGALWHLSSLPDARMPIVEAGAIEPLVLKLENRIIDPPLRRNEGEEGEEDDENRKEERLIITALTLANLSMSFQTRKELPERMKEGFTKISEFLRSKDYTRFTLHNMVWTTLKPLCDLLQAPHWEVNELGCFLVGCLSRTNQQTSKLFLEGAVESLKILAVRRPRKENEESEEQLRFTREVAKFALSNLGEDVSKLKEDKEEKEKDKEEDRSYDYLSLLGLPEDIQEILRKHHMDKDSIKLVKKKEHLSGIGIDSLGPQLKIMNYGKSLRRAEKPQKMKRRKKNKEHKDETTNDTSPCLVCYDQDKAACLVPCGHVVTCELCAKILIARGDPCPICRTKIERSVIPFYL